MTERKMPPAREALVLAKHGHESDLSPETLLRTAKSDIEAARFNRRIRAERKALPAGHPSLKDIPPLRQYAFLGKHVRKAATPLDLLRIAAEDVATGRDKARTPNTVRVYRSAIALAAAVELAENEIV